MALFIKVRDFVYYNRKIILGVIFIIILLLFSYFEFVPSNEIVYDEGNINIVAEDNSVETISKEDYYVVDIKGAIKNPGTYSVTKDKRVIDVINMAGGFLEDSDVTSVNLSKKITDEMMIIIPFKMENNVVGENIINSNVYDDGKVSINSASLSELMTIKGIGEVKANSIIEYRNNNGPFNSIEDIKNVNGIGSSTFEKIKDYIKL